MINLNADPVSLTYPTNSQKESESRHRLIVLVSANIDFSAATQRIWDLAHARDMHVYLLGLCTDGTEEPRLRRGLITMASLLQDGKSSVETKVDTGTSWMEALKAVYESGDGIVCFAEQQTGLLRKPVNEILESTLKATIYILSNPTAHKFNANKLSQVSTWLVVIAVVAGFAILQAKIVQLPAGWLQNILLILSIIPEFWLIWVWDSRFG